MGVTDAAALLAEVDPAVWLVTAAVGSRRGGLIATFVSNASIVPAMPRMLVGVARQHHTWGLIEASGAFALHLLGEDNVPLAWRFGLQSGRDADKFDGLPFTTGATGSPLLDEMLGWLDCRIETSINTGDRTVYLGAVVAASVTRKGPVLTARALIGRARAEERERLRELMDRDRATDAEAIRAWRSSGLSAHSIQ